MDDNGKDRAHEETEKSISVIDADFTVWTEYDCSDYVMHIARSVAWQKV